MCAPIVRFDFCLLFTIQVFFLFFFCRGSCFGICSCAYVVFFGIDMNLGTLCAHGELFEHRWVWEIMEILVIPINIGKE